VHLFSSALLKMFVLMQWKPAGIPAYTICC
jgi:hypothetical protein